MSTDAHFDAHFEAVLQSPRLPEYSAIIIARLSDEQARRQRFYEEMTDEFKMEFINGEVILHSPARRGHLIASGNLYTLLHAFTAKHGGEVFVEKALCVFERNDYEPDIVYFGPSKCAAFTKNTMKFPVPDFVVEILSESTSSRDRGVKFEDYALHGVREYWIIAPETETLEQFVLNANREYELKISSAAEEVSSVVVEGFRIPIRAIFDPALNQAARAKLESSP
jgi:Uma2 family endonuclease